MIDASHDFVVADGLETEMSLPSNNLIPKAGDVLKVIALGRISTIHQDVENIDASFRYVEEFLQRMYRGPLDIKFLGEQASGMRTDRATILEAEALIAGGAIDLVIAEDLSRIYRNPRYQFRFIQDSVDVGTRVICIGDNLDTADENWEITMGAAALRHGLHIPDTRRRVRRTATHSFHKGGMVQKVRFGYRKLSVAEASTGAFGSKDLRIAKVAECTPIIGEMVDRLLSGEPYPVIADWLNGEGIAPGSYVTSRRWSGRLVTEYLRSPLLAGLRIFRSSIYRPIYKTGRHKAVKNPDPETKHYPELAHLSAERHEAVVCEIAARGRSCKGRNKRSKREGIPRSRSLWPGQAMTCHVCGGLFYYAGDHLRCANSLSRNGRRCWNCVQVSVQVVRDQIAGLIMEYLDRHQAHRREFAQSAWGILKRAETRRRQLPDLAYSVAALNRERENLIAAIAAGGPIASLVSRLKSVEAKLADCQTATAASAADGEQKVVTAADVEGRLADVVRSLLDESFEFAHWLRRFIPELVICPIQALDTPLVRPRARIRLNWELLGPLPSTDTAESTEPGPRTVLDLFEPPLHIRSIDDCCRIRTEHPDWSQRQMAESLGLTPMTVKRTLDYYRRMKAEGLAEPYRLLDACPLTASRWNRRHGRTKKTGGAK